MIYKYCKCGKPIRKGLKDKEKIYPAMLIDDKKDIVICMECYKASKEV